MAFRRMRALVFHAPHDVRVETVKDPELRDPNGAIVRITRSSICGSDLHLYHGSVPAMAGTVMGHEGVGVVEDVGKDVRRFRKGQRVLVPAVLGCGECEPCRRHYPVGCLVLPVKIPGISLELGGAQAEAMYVPAADANLREIPPELGDEQVLFLTDILPTGYTAARNAGIAPGDTVVVLGSGPVGLCAIEAAGLFGAARIFAVDLVPERLEKAREFGAEPIDARVQDPRTAVLEATEGRGADAVIEAVGSRDTFRLAIELARVGGVVSAVGVLFEEAFPFPMGTALLKDLTFRVGLVDIPSSLPRLFPLVRSRRLDPTRLLTHRMSLDEAPEAYRLFAERRDGCLKIVLQG